MSVFSALFVLKENGTQSHSARFLNWGDHVNSVPDLAASPTCLDSNKIKTEQNWADITSDSDNDEDELEIL